MDSEQADDLNALRSAALKSLQGKKESSMKCKKQRTVSIVNEDEDLNELRLAALMTRRQNQQITVIQKVALGSFPPARHRIKNIPRYLLKPSNNLISLTPGPGSVRKTEPPPRVVSTIPTPKPTFVNKPAENIEKRVPDKFRRFDGDSSSDDDDDLLLEEDGLRETTLDEEDDGSDKESVKSFSSVESTKSDIDDINSDFSDIQQTEDKEINRLDDKKPDSPQNGERLAVTVQSVKPSALQPYTDMSKLKAVETKPDKKQRQRTVSITDLQSVVNKPVSQAKIISCTKRPHNEDDIESVESSDLSLSDDAEHESTPTSKTATKPSGTQGSARRVSVSQNNNSRKVGQSATTSDLRSKLKSNKVPRKTKKLAQQENMIIDLQKERRIILKIKSSEIKSEEKIELRSESLKRQSRDSKQKTIIHKGDKISNNDRKFIDRNKNEKKTRKTVYLKASRTKERSRQKSSSSESEISFRTTTDEDDDEIIGTANRFPRSARREREPLSRTSATDRRRFIKRVYDNNEYDRKVPLSKPIHARLGSTKSNNRRQDIFSRIDKTTQERIKPRKNRALSGNRTKDLRNDRKRRNINQELDSSDDILEKRIKMIKEKNARILQRQREIEMEKKKYG